MCCERERVRWNHSIKTEHMFHEIVACRLFAPQACKRVFETRAPRSDGQKKTTCARNVDVPWPTSSNFHGLVTTKMQHTQHHGLRLRCCCKWVTMDCAILQFHCSRAGPGCKRNFRAMFRQGALRRDELTWGSNPHCRPYTTNNLNLWTGCKVLTMLTMLTIDLKQQWHESWKQTVSNSASLTQCWCGSLFFLAKRSPGCSSGLAKNSACPAERA